MKRTESLPQPLPGLPSTAVPLPGKSDIGKRVEVNTVEGALKKVTGTVIYGPYTFTMTVKVRDERDKEVTSQPYWRVRLDKYGGNTLCFVKRELTFLEN